MPKTCAIKSCKIRSNLNPSSGFCNGCEKKAKVISQTVSSNDEQPYVVQSSKESNTLPKVDLQKLVSTHAMIENGGQVDIANILTDIFGVLINVYARNEEVEHLKATVKNLEAKISHLEAKVGSSEEVSYRSGIVIKNSPLPKEGEDTQTFF